MSEENLIHVKLSYSEALQSKKDVLSTEISALQIAKHIKAYRYHRDNELDLKVGLQKKVRELRSTIINLQKILPKLAIPSLLRKEGYSEEGYKVEPKEKQARTRNKGAQQTDSTVEDQLWEIQRKLNELQGKNF